MSETISLNQDPGWITLGSSGMRLRAPGLKGNVIWRSAQEHPPLTSSELLATAAAAGPTDLVEQALREAALTDLDSLTLPSGTASFTAPTNQIVVERPPIDEDQIEFAIYRDESGVISLHRPLPSPPPTASAPAAGIAAAAVHKTPKKSFHYVIPLRQATPPIGGTPAMAMLGGIAGKVIRFVGRTATNLAGQAVFAAAKLWEDHYRPEGFHWGGTPETLLASPTVPPSSVNWQTVSGQKSLLFIHGTISSTLGGFAGIRNFPADATALFNAYNGRVIGFNHHTLTKSVPQNAADFYCALPPGNYQFDIISHSRGGLLARTLKELTPAAIAQLIDPGWNPPAGVNLQIGKIVLVGTPNQGTPLANPIDLPQAVSYLASIASSFSQDAAATGLGGLFAIFGGIVEAGLGSLPGLEDMNPGNPFLVELNAASTDIADYYGIQADFQPSGSLAVAIADNAIDALFRCSHDLVVPTLGVSSLNGQTLPGRFVDAYPQSANVCHIHYFYQQGTWDSITHFLP
jgi:hypothetical protein